MKSHSITKTALKGVLLIGLAGCVGDHRVGFAQAGTGKSVYDRQCMQCHGTEGVGAGPASLGLGVAPPGLRNLSRQNNGVFPRQDLVRIIAGYAGRDDPDAAMPEFGKHGLAYGVAEPEDDAPTTLPRKLAALLEYLESMAGPASRFSAPPG